MSKLSSIGVQRLRTLHDLSTRIKLTPITVLIGRNSAGKSTFARLLPLLRQSAEQKKRGPILWFDNLVDFGTFTQAVTRGEKDLEISFELESIEDSGPRGRLLTWGDTRPQNLIQLDEATVSMTLACDEESGATYASRLCVTAAGTSVVLSMSSSQKVETIEVDGKALTWNSERMRIRVEQGSLLPRLRFIEKRGANDGLWYLARNPWRTAASDFIHAQLHQNTSKGTSALITSQIPLTERKAICQRVRKIDGPASWKVVRETFNESGHITKALINKLVIANIEFLLDRLDDALSESAKGVRYLKPLRATAERYYRRVDLSVSEIDPEGRNLPMFLDSLNRRQLDNFRAWLRDNLGIDVEPRREGAQITLLARTKNDSGSSNVADMGFGISQILPIAAQLWASRNTKDISFGKTTFVVIEQPELHLHPAFQARIADVLAGVVRKEVHPKEQMRSQEKHEPPCLVVETHSQHLVNRLGALIEEGNLSPNDVSIVLFEANRLVRNP